MNEFNILSEKSEHHWPFLNTRGSILLDIGCGRHDTPDLPDTSPVYLGQEAERVIAVDASQKEIDFFISSDLDKNKFTFICRRIESKEDILDLIREYNPSVIKCDIEEHETNFYGITSDEMSGINEIAIEYHTFEILENIKNKMIEWGFFIHSEGKFGFVNAPQMGVLFARR